MARQFTLGKGERLKHRKLIEQLFRQGKNFTVFPYRVCYMFVDELAEPLQAGFTASTRNFKKAVDRNRIKRITKEAYRLQKNELKAELTLRNKKLALFFIYTDKELPAFEIITERVRIILKKLSSILHEMDTAGR